MAATLRGGCQCGAVRYIFYGPLPPAYCCHCGECKKQSASAFSMSIALEWSRLSVESETATYESRAFSGARKLAFFCPKCGARLWHRASVESEWITLKVGTLDDADKIEPRGHLWVSKKQPWIVLPDDVPAFDVQPDDVQTWRSSLS